MAKIKTKKYVIDGEEIKVDFNCSSSGVFSFSLRQDLKTKLGIFVDDSKRISLSELEKTIDDCVFKYKETTKVNELVIGIIYKSSNKLSLSEDKETCLFNKRSKFSTFEHHRESSITFAYQVMIKQTCNGQIIYYDTTKYNASLYEDNQYRHKPDIIIEDYNNINIIYSTSEFTIIPFTQESLANIESIQEQLRKASQFIYELVSSDNFENLISSNLQNILDK